MADKSDDDLEDECVYNLNMYSVISWKTAAENLLKIPGRKPTHAFQKHFVINLFRLLPLIFVWCEVVILIGILDEGAKIKYLTEHDKTFQLPRFIWSKQHLKLNAMQTCRCRAGFKIKAKPT